MAQIYLLHGDLDNSVATLRALLTFPRITPAELSNNPQWTPRRSHPAFPSLLATP
ncbi:MAG TPA: hypothetical protein VFJ81_10710 [Gemmatimonadales bacterium]|nr:hypothetical protein [Gemmatimonadales bacterium]